MEFNDEVALAAPQALPPGTQPTPSDKILSPAELLTYDRVLLLWSGGKDSLACLLALLEAGYPRDRIEMHHHRVDGAPGEHFMDWPITSAYCKAVADHYGIRYTESWRVGGFLGEMTRTNAPTGPVAIPTIEGGHLILGGDGPLGTRNKFPQVAASLQVRWCSSATKIDVGARYLTNDLRFRIGKTLVISGERAEESTNRATYEAFEPDRSDNRKGVRVNRHIDHLRMVHTWTERDVWEIIERHKMVVHPCYYLGWSRGSCRFCIFGNEHQWASARAIAPVAFAVVADYERRFGVTIQRKFNIIQLADKGTSHADPASEWARLSNSTVWDIPVVTDHWVLPKGAYAKSGGPT